MLLSFPHHFKVDNCEVRKVLPPQQNVAIQRSNSSNNNDKFKFGHTLSNSHQFEVMYVGKIKVYQKRAPPTFIDDAVENFLASEDSKSKFNLLPENDSDLSSSGEYSDCPRSPSAQTRYLTSFNDLTNSARRPCSVTPLTTCKEYKESGEEESSTSPSPNQLQSEKLNNKPSIETPLIKFHESPTATVTEKDFADQTSSSRPSSAASCIILATNSANLLTSGSLITNTQSLDEGGRASIMRDLKAVESEKENRKKSTTPIASSKADKENSNSIKTTDILSPSSQTAPTTPLTTATLKSNLNSPNLVDIPSKAIVEKQTSLPFRTRTNSGGNADLRRSRQSAKFRNRTMLFLIGRLEICLISPDLQQVIFSKAFNYVSHCSQGVKYSDHFGFICRESSFYANDNYVGYVFRCQTEQLVNEIMHTLKQAFHNAHQAYVSSKNRATMCDECPLLWFHKLQSEVENCPPEKALETILERLESLPEVDKIDVMTSYEGSRVSSIQEQNTIFLRLLKQMSEKNQAKHVHVDKKSPLDNLKQKAKRSISNSFETIFKLAHGESSDDISKLHLPNSPSSSIKHQQPEPETFNDDQPSRSRSHTIGDVRDLQTHNYSPISHPLSSRSESIPLHSSPAADAVNNTNVSPFYNIFFKLGSQKSNSGSLYDQEQASSNSEEMNTSKPQKPVRKISNQSWHRAIFSNVKANTQSTTKSNLIESIGLGPSPPPPAERKRDRHELRELWRKAINQQITLIRMEKENLRLQKRQNVATCIRMKLDYQEITPCLKETVKVWEDILSSNIKDASLEYTLREMIKKGVPRHKRGEIWIFCAKFNQKHRKHLSNCRENEVFLEMSYRELLQNLTSQQHAILVDLGRTFPKHPHFSEPLGAGQLSLFNLLKAYSLFDKVVGYCQGLSFVAAILLLHMNECEAFDMMKYLLFYLGLREQYKPDMSALQIQLYQLTRLLYDYHYDLYEHFDTYEIMPTLYAAPWFLTLFASQFPIGFVARLFDLIFFYGMEAIFRLSISLLITYKDLILASNSFESIMDIFRNNISNMDVIQMERVFNQVFALDICRSLIMYEAEYNVLQEEMLIGSLPASANVSFESRNDFSNNSSKSIQANQASSPVAPSMVDQSGLIKELEAENKQLKSANMELQDQLHVARSHIHDLESSIDSYKSSIKRLEDRVRAIEEERLALYESLTTLRSKSFKEEAV